MGETLDYRIYWGVIPVGSSRVTTEWIEEDGRTLIAIRFRTKSNDVLSKIYPVDDFAGSDHRSGNFSAGALHQETQRGPLPGG